MWKFPLDMPLMMLMGASSREQMCCWEKGKAIEECIHIEHFYDVSKGKKEEREEKRREEKKKFYFKNIQSSSWATCTSVRNFAVLHSTSPALLLAFFLVV